MNFDAVFVVHQEVINLGIKNTLLVRNCLHDIVHVKDTVGNCREILKEVDADSNVCLVSAYWHDVGCAHGEYGHEKRSAEMLKKELDARDYDSEFIEKSYGAIRYHGWEMKPETVEGLILKDADKLSFLSAGKWKECLKEDPAVLQLLVELIPYLRDETLHFNISRKIYDQKIAKLVQFLYSYW